MTDAELLDRVRSLRQAGRSPKEIARALGLPPSRVGPSVRALAAERTVGVPAVVGCWVSPGWDAGLSVDGHPDWPRSPGQPGDGGLACVLVVWEQRYGTVACCTYLVDTWCLGVKDAIGPRRMAHAEVSAFRDECFGGYDEDPLPAPVELVQHLVWGSVDYARGLGLEPHADYSRAAGLLQRPSEPCSITFGRDGRPCYIAGPYDDARRVLRTLERSVGASRFGFLVAAD